jgi:16S rRNA (uracil1498-N3)-methyltransferase
MLLDAQLAHCLLFSDLAQIKPGDSVEISGEEAHHAARVKRVRLGERLGLLNGNGTVAIGTLGHVGGSKSKPLLHIEIEHVETQAPCQPDVEIWSALPKGDRLDRMIDQLTQIGVSTYRPLMCDRSQRKPETIRPEKLERIANEAMKQCRRAWKLNIDDPIDLQAALSEPDIILADALGPVWGQPNDSRQRTVILVGPEGGWSNTERGLFVETNVPIRRFGMFVMRIEAAASASASIVMGSSNPAIEC